MTKDGDCPAINWKGCTSLRYSKADALVRLLRDIAENDAAARAMLRPDAAGLAWIGLGKHFAGNDEETEAHVLQALRISPRDTRAWVWMLIVGFARLHSSRDEEAVASLNRSIELNPNNPIVHFCLAAALAHLGHLGEAREAARAGLELDPSFSSARLRRSMTFSDNPVFLARRERLYEGLRMAGVPDG